jgi:hypothetical protein
METIPLSFLSDCKHPVTIVLEAGTKLFPQFVSELQLQYDVAFK